MINQTNLKISKKAQTIITSIEDFHGSQGALQCRYKVTFIDGSYYESDSKADIISHIRGYNESDYNEIRDAVKHDNSETQNVSHGTKIKYANEIVRVKQVISESTLPVSKITSSYQVIEWLQEEYANESQEVLILICLNTKKVITDFSVVTRGTVNQSIAHPRDIFQRALLSNARSIILAHNHPSGDTTPSRNDNQMTDRIKKCSDFMGIELLDHIIIGDNNHYSYAEHGKI